MSAKEPIVTGDVAALRHNGLREFVFCTGDANFIKPAHANQRFFTVGATPARDNDMAALRTAIGGEKCPSRVKTSTIISLIAASRAADRDIEQLGALTAVTVDMIRDALAEADAS